MNTQKNSLKNNTINFTNKTVHVFDLDGTVIESGHRTLPAICNVTGDLDLNQYRKLATHKNIMKDTLLPLSELMRALIDTGEKVAIVTARHLQKSDYVFLRQAKLRNCYIGSRDRCHKISNFTGLTAVEHSELKDAEYKEHWLNYIKQVHFPDCESYIMYDDHQGVLNMCRKVGFLAMDAVAINKLYLIGQETAFKVMQAEHDLAMQVEETLFQEGISAGYRAAMESVLSDWEPDFIDLDDETEYTSSTFHQLPKKIA